MTTESPSRSGAQGQNDQSSHATLGQKPGQKPTSGSTSQDKSKDPQFNKERSAGQTDVREDGDMKSPAQSSPKDKGEASRGTDKHGSDSQRPGQNRGGESQSR